ncbi:hypothetical protein IMSHALPRED_005962 [Imshaugia aleurites]|uniref:Rhodopsin domain-containing protein n=1 Tax=Imshaugia aleurites TaxID=172621 RepID=A0A8H3ID17_9LECA|nr:hypothetical protein IMSHALPRED_005962 [Imshaugia aleurites]
MLAIICTSLVTAEVAYGTGRHYQTLDSLQKVMAVKLNWISQPFAIFSCGVGKISIALLLLRIMPKNKIRERFLYILITLLFVINIIGLAFIFGQCSPARELWEPFIKGSCLKPYVQRDVSFFRASFSALSDFLLALFPLVIIYDLQMKLAVKVGLGCAMSLGLIATGAAIVKTVQLESLTARDDYTYDTVDLVIWFSTEMYTVIIAACVPTLRPLSPLLFGRSPYRQGVPKKWNTYLSASRRKKHGYRAHDDEDAHRLQTLPPSRSYGYSGSSKENTMDTNGAGDRPPDVDVESEEVILPKPDVNEIIKTTEVDVSISQQEVAKAAPFARREATIRAENTHSYGLYGHGAEARYI